MPAIPIPIQITQPDGELLTIKLNGDEKIHWYSSVDGYTLMKNNDGYLCYAVNNVSGNLEASTVIATDVEKRPASASRFLNEITKGIFYSDSQVTTFMQIWNITDGAKSSSRSYEDSGVIGIFKTLCVLVEYPEKPMVKTKDEFQALMTQVGYSDAGGKSSVRDYYLAASYGQWS